MQWLFLERFCGDFPKPVEGMASIWSVVRIITFTNPIQFVIYHPPTIRLVTVRVPKSVVNWIKNLIKNIFVFSFLTGEVK
jgi:hypothetical protein